MLRCPHCNKVIPMALFTTFIGKIGGSKTSEAKKRSSRENGLKGGRPKVPLAQVQNLSNKT